MLTRLSESEADAFTIMRIAGHSSVIVSQRYVHASPQSLERAFERFDVMNRSERGEHVEVPTISFTEEQRRSGTEASKPFSVSKMGA